MMGMTAFRRMSHDFARLAVRHVRGGEPTNGRQGKSAAFGRAQVVGWIEVFPIASTRLAALSTEIPSISTHSAPSAFRPIVEQL